MFGPKRQDRTTRTDTALQCSFCEKAQDQVRNLIAGPSVFICDECVDVCNEIIAEDERFSANAKSKAQAEIERQAEPSDAPPHVTEIPCPGDDVRCSLCRMPTLLEDGVVLFLLYIVAWLDRVNVRFAALQMNADLAFSAS